MINNKGTEVDHRSYISLKSLAHKVNAIPMIMLQALLDT